MLILLTLPVACGGDGVAPGDNTATPGTILTQATATGAPARLETATAGAPQVTETANAAEDIATEQPASPTSLPMATAAPPEEEPSPTASPAPTRAVAQALSSISLAPVVSGLDSPTLLTNAGDERLFVLEQEGRIRIVQDGQLLEEPFLDITHLVGFNSNEQGLLGLAFPPDYEGSGAFYAYYTDHSGATVLSRFFVSGDSMNRAAPDMEQVVLRVAQPFPNHNGGHILFGPDGYLYVGLGDGGSGGDPQGNGQNADTLLGSILRLDVSDVSPGATYTIPPDNPFAGGGGAPEVWGYGLRNPWRFSFDPLDGTWYVADVGQNQYEEVHVVSAAEAPGANYGWNIMEGLHCYNSDPCDQSGLLLPVVEYSHQQGGCSVTGGYVYRGERFEALAGNYFFGDYCSGTIWALRQDEEGTWSTGSGALVTVDGQITSFGLDAAGEVYVVTREGGILRIEP